MTAAIIRRAASTVAQGAPDSALFVNAAAQGGPPAYIRHFTGVEPNAGAVANNQALNGAAASMIGSPIIQSAGYVTLPAGTSINTDLDFTPNMSWFGITRCTGWTGAAGGYSSLMGTSELNGQNGNFGIILNILAQMTQTRLDTEATTTLNMPATGAPGSPTGWMLWGCRFSFSASGGIKQIDDFTAGTSANATTSGTLTPNAKPIYIGSFPEETTANFASTDWKAAVIFPYFIAPGSTDEAATLAQLRAWALNDLGATV